MFPLEEVIFSDANIMKKPDIKRISGGGVQEQSGCRGQPHPEVCVSCLPCSEESSCLIPAPHELASVRTPLPLPQCVLRPRHSSL